MERERGSQWVCFKWEHRIQLCFCGVARPAESNLVFFRCGDVTHLERDEDALLVVHAFEPRVPSFPLLIRRVFVLRCVRVGFERVDDGCEPLAESPRLVEAAGDWVVP